MEASINAVACVFCDSIRRMSAAPLSRNKGPRCSRFKYIGVWGILKQTVISLTVFLAMLAFYGTARGRGEDVPSGGSTNNISPKMLTEQVQTKMSYFSWHEYMYRTNTTLVFVHSVLTSSADLILTETYSMVVNPFSGQLTEQGKCLCELVS